MFLLLLDDLQTFACPIPGTKDTFTCFGTGGHVDEVLDYYVTENLFCNLYELILLFVEKF